ncbi:LysM peptidoglycan-binding domain-containing protein [Kyrpidia spormannii]|uniref:LysM domain-containing protein n=2 Tax=Kyrpidia spormannii TaxID=2055160 RepID=A0A6F9E3J7_9BACL|nr:LysM peptidoglycan-binding domain-containing protein [Kyrpidia spormannii]CAB3390977.1 conserved protein of unknown function [Kyrpidia spormannii]CAB3391885.1 conserved protein of unknown function [Kyrpidia spormannii]
MREGKRQRTIQVRVDRQCEIPELQGDESLEDMALATEITSFSREGDAYILEGYIEVIGYAAPPEDRRGDGWTRPEGFLFDAVADQGALKSIREKLPFELRVRAEDQEGEVLHVKTRLGSWDVHVLGPGVLQLRADLIVDGFSATGYYFRCGDQEEGFWPEGAGETTEVGRRSLPDQPEEISEAAEDLPSFEFQAGQDPVSAPPGWTTGPMDPVPGVELSSVREEQAGPAGDPAGGSDDPEADADHAGERGVDGEEHPDGRVADDTSGFIDTGPADVPVDFTEKGSGWAVGEKERPADSLPEVPLTEESVGEEMEEEPGAATAVDEGERVAVTAVRAGQERPESFAWAKLYQRAEMPASATLTFRRVNEQESLLGIAEEYRVPVTDLMRLNGLSGEIVQPGQWLVVPRRRKE